MITHCLLMPFCPRFRQFFKLTTVPQDKNARWLKVTVPTLSTMPVCNLVFHLNSATSHGRIRTIIFYGRSRASPCIIGSVAFIASHQCTTHPCKPHTCCMRVPYKIEPYFLALLRAPTEIRSSQFIRIQWRRLFACESSVNTIKQVKSTPFNPFRPIHAAYNQ